MEGIPGDCLDDVGFQVVRDEADEASYGLCG
jgi:hypothetical protein